MLFVAIDTGNPGRIITIDPNNGTTEDAFTYEKGGFIALESAGETLYGVYGYESADSKSGEYYSLVTIDRVTGIFDLVESFIPVETPIESLAYNSFNNALYGVSGSNLIQIDLGSFTITPLGPMTFGSVISLDFDPNNSLYAATRGGNRGEPGKLFEIDHATATVNREAGPLTFENASSADVTGLTFVVGAPPGVDPIKTICSSTLTSSASASSATAAPKLSRFKRKKNPLHRAIGLFKFEGKAGETVTLNAKAEDEESVEAAVEESSVSERKSRWLNYWRGKGRVFLGIRDSIPNLDFRARKKDKLPLTMSATLPADGTYYVMLIRPLLRFYKTDYCLTLESDMPDSQAWESFDVAWPSDDAGDDTASTTTAAKTVEVQSVDDQASGETTDELAADKTAEEDDPADVDEGDSEGDDEQQDEKNIVGESSGDSPEHSPAASLLNPDDEGDSEGDDEQLTEETTVEESDEVVAAETAEDDRSAGADSDSENLDENETEGAESAEGNTSDVVEEKLTTEEAPTL
jgi:hypothetical protein